MSRVPREEARLRLPFVQQLVEAKQIDSPDVCLSGIGPVRAGNPDRD